MASSTNCRGAEGERTTALVPSAAFIGILTFRVRGAAGGDHPGEEDKESKELLAKRQSKGKEKPVGQGLRERLRIRGRDF